MPISTNTTLILPRFNDGIWVPTVPTLHDTMCTTVLMIVLLPCLDVAQTSRPHRDVDSYVYDWWFYAVALMMVSRYK